MEDQALDIMELLVDWFETIEEVELSAGDRQKLNEIGQSLTGLSYAALENGFTPDDFEAWLRMDVLEQWSALMEDAADLDEDLNLPPVESFYSYVKGGEDRLYFQMLKGCSQAQEMSA